MYNVKYAQEFGYKWRERVREQGTAWERNWGEFHRSCNESCIKGHHIFSKWGERYYSLKKEAYVKGKRGVKGPIQLRCSNHIGQRNGEEGEKRNELGAQATRDNLSVYYYFN